MSPSHGQYQDGTDSATLLTVSIRCDEQRARRWIYTTLDAYLFVTTNSVLANTSPDLGNTSTSPVYLAGSTMGSACYPCLFGTMSSELSPFLSGTTSSGQWILRLTNQKKKSKKRRKKKKQKTPLR
jgi:hypothetical protein